MTYFLCSKADHYVKAHRGETLTAGGTCPSGDCKGKLRPAPEADDVVKCPGCSKGVLLPVVIDEKSVELCCYCGQSRLVRT